MLYQINGRETLFVDRSRDDCGGECEFKEWLNYHAFGTGIVSRAKNWHLIVGIFVHVGVAQMLYHFQSKKSYLMEWCDGGVNLALAMFDKEMERINNKFLSRGLEIEHKDADAANTIEARLMIEGLLRCWFLTEGKQIFDYYRIVFIERETNIPIFRGDGTPLSPDVVLMSRIDAILEHKEQPSDAVIYSLKTIRKEDERATNAQHQNMQNALELLGAEWLSHMVRSKLLAEYEQIKANPAYAGRVTEIERDIPKDYSLWIIRYCNLVKGITKWNAEERRYALDSSLLRGWRKKPGTKANGPAYTSQWTYVTGTGADSSLYAGAYDKFGVQQLTGGMKKWIELHQDDAVYPGPALFDQIVPERLPKVLSPYAERWKVDQFIHSRLRQEQKLREMNRCAPEPLTQDFVMMFFPKRFGACFYPSKCEYNALCHSPDVNTFDAATMEQIWTKYEPRTPHHTAELEIFKKVGLLDGI